MTLGRCYTGRTDPKRIQEVPRVQQVLRVRQVGLACSPRTLRTLYFVLRTSYFVLLLSRVTIPDGGARSRTDRFNAVRPARGRRRYSWSVHGVRRGQPRTFR